MFNLADTPERMELEERFAAEAKGLAREFIATAGHLENGLISALFLARAYQTIDSTCTLAKLGALGDGMSVARTTVELDIEHAYILQKDTESRWERYVAFDATTTKKLLKGIAALSSSKVTPELMAQWEKHAAEAKQLSGDDRNWAGKGIDTRQRALATGRDHDYDVAYRDLCGASHAGFATFAHVTDLTSSELPIGIRVGYGAPCAKPIAIALCATIGILKAATTAPELADLRRRVEDLDQRYRATYEERAQH